MKCLLSEAIPQLPDPNHFASIGWIVVSLFALCGGVYYVMQLVDRIRGDKPHPPNEQLDQSMSAMSDRITKAELQIGELWTVMRAEDKAIRQEVARVVADFEKAIGKLDGTLGQVNQTMQLILEKELNR
jgi:hypothetical protein